MPVVTKYICDSCGAEKGVTNHWFKITSSRSSDRSGLEFMAVWSWASQHDKAPMYCGEKCVLAALSKWMQERKDQDTDTGGVEK